MAKAHWYGQGQTLSPFDKALETLKPQDARQWQEMKKVDWIRWRSKLFTVLRDEYPSITIRPYPASIQSAVTRLFQLRKYPELAAELPQLNEKLRYSTTITTTAIRFVMQWSE